MKINSMPKLNAVIECNLIICKAPIVLLSPMILAILIIIIQIYKLLGSKFVCKLNFIFKKKKNMNYQLKLHVYHPSDENQLMDYSVL